MKSRDLRTEAQQKEGVPYYPGVIDCGNCGAHWHVSVARKVTLAAAASTFECPRCGLVGSDVEGGHATAVIPCGLSPEGYLLVEDDGDTYEAGDDLLA
jgi:transcription elongation factor Elf1